MTDTTHEAPERIWAGKYHGTWWQSYPHHQMTEYVRADLVQAAVAAERERWQSMSMVDFANHLTTRSIAAIRKGGE